MSVLVVGSTALDSVKTPYDQKPRLLGGSASYAAVAASYLAPVRLVGVVGEDFPKRYIELFECRKIDLEGLEVRAGKTFHWSGEYELNMNNRRTLATELGVLGEFDPRLPASYRGSPYVLLANLAPVQQHAVLDQVERPRFVVADTMDLWLNVALKDLLRLLRRVDAFVLNDQEARQLTGEDNVVAALRKIHNFGPRYVIVKKGEHGSILSSREGLFLAPAYPLNHVVDPTGAGDSFAGAFLGYVARRGGRPNTHLRQAMIYASAIASFCCEGFGLTQISKLRSVEIRGRVRALEKMIRI
jgi:cytidine kinase